MDGRGGVGDERGEGKMMGYKGIVDWWWWQ